MMMMMMMMMISAAASASLTAPCLVTVRLGTKKQFPMGRSVLENRSGTRTSGEAAQASKMLLAASLQSAVLGVVSDFHED